MVTSCGAAVFAFALLIGTPIVASAEPKTGPNTIAALGAFATAWARVRAYTATVAIVERKDTNVQNEVFTYAFRQPSNVSVHVTAGPNAGVTMVWDGGTTITAHRGSGFLALLKKTFPLRSPEVTTIRGSSIDELSFGAILGHAQQQAGTLLQTSETGPDGNPVEAVTLVSADPSTNAGLTREVVKLSATTHLPVEVLGYDGSTLVRQIDFSNVNLSINDTRVAGNDSAGND